MSQFLFTRTGYQGEYLVTRRTDGAAICRVEQLGTSWRRFPLDGSSDGAEWFPTREEAVAGHVAFDWATYYSSKAKSFRDRMVMVSHH